MSDDIAAVETPTEIVPKTGVIPVGSVDNAPAPVVAETPAPDVATEEVTAHQQAALDAYWSADTPAKERAAMATMKELQMPQAEPSAWEIPTTNGQNAPLPSPRPPLAVRAMALEAALRTAHPGSLVIEVIRVALVYEKHLTE